MKKIFLYFILSCLFFSCKEKNNQDKIKESFNEYVNINFDDPKELKEITSIELIDSFSTKKIKNDLNDVFSSFSHLHSIQDSLSHRFTFLQDSLPNDYFIKIKPRDRDIFLDALTKKSSLLFAAIQKTQNGMMDDPEIPIDITEYPDTLIYIYEIKYRINKNGKLTINKIFAKTNHDLSLIYFDENKNVINHDNEEFLEKVKNSTYNLKNWIEIKKEELEYTEKTVEILEFYIQNHW